MYPPLSTAGDAVVFIMRMRMLVVIAADDGGGGAAPMIKTCRRLRGLVIRDDGDALQRLCVGLHIHRCPACRRRSRDL